MAYCTRVLEIRYRYNANNTYTNAEMAFAFGIGIGIDCEYLDLDGSRWVLDLWFIRLLKYTVYSYWVPVFCQCHGQSIIKANRYTRQRPRSNAKIKVDCLFNLLCLWLVWSVSSSVCVTFLSVKYSFADGQTGTCTNNRHIRFRECLYPPVRLVVFSFPFHRLGSAPTNPTHLGSAAD